MREYYLATFKILMIGESGVGKSSLLLSFADDAFNPDQRATIGFDFKAKTISVFGGKLVKLILMDIAGQKRYRIFGSTPPSYYRGIQGAILTYDVNSRESFDALDSWIHELKTYTAESNVVNMLIGNKINKDRVITSEKGLRFATDHEMLFIETSAKANENVQADFEEMTSKIIQIATYADDLNSRRNMSFTLSDRVPSSCNTGKCNC